MTIIGFTGTRNGMTPEQKREVSILVLFYGDDAIGIHGDCIGADADFDAICKAECVATKCRPCTLDNMRAHCTEAIAEPKPPMQRNRDIVADATVMIACPHNMKRIKKGSGTWATVGFAEKAGKHLYIVYPDGRIDERSPKTAGRK